jgi:hypothetical protein
MQKIFILVVMVFALAACAPAPTQTSIAVQVPDAINVAIGIGIVALLTAGFAFVFEKLGLDLRGFATPIAATVSLFIVTELQNVINAIPEAYDPQVDFALKLIAYLLGAVGLLRLRYTGSENSENKLLP